MNRFYLQEPGSHFATVPAHTQLEIWLDVMAGDKVTTRSVVPDCRIWPETVIIPVVSPTASAFAYLVWAKPPAQVALRLLSPRV